MAATEVTSLTQPTDPPVYVNIAGVLVARNNKMHQFQCCIFAFFLAMLIMALVVAVSYTMNDIGPAANNLTSPEGAVESPALRLMEAPGGTKFPAGNVPGILTVTEWSAAKEAGDEAIIGRIRADAESPALPASSPDSRHQYAVRTSLRAGELSLGGIGELAASRYLKSVRTKLGMPTAFGAYFKNDWLPANACKEFSTMPCQATKYREYDGTCNHERNLGAALTPFHRNLPADYSDGLEAPRVAKSGNALPSAREISLKVHAPAPSTNPSFTVMLAVYGQFLDHDITATAISQGTNGSSLSCCPRETRTHPECFPVQVGPGDPVFDAAGRNCMEFVRSAPAPQCKIGPREQLNQVTSFIDASVIYGSDKERAEQLRLGEKGQLRMFLSPDNRTLLPQSLDPNDGCNRNAEMMRGRYCFTSGDGRANENLHLTTMHLLWARQHNRVADALYRLNPQWDDEKIYQEARLIVGAQMQHITYNEFLPIILGQAEYRRRKLAPLPFGYRSRDSSAAANPAIANGFAASAFRFAHTLLPGLMKLTDAQKSSSSYQELHRILFNPYSLYSKGGMESALNTATSNSIQKTTTHVTSQLTKHLFEDPFANVTIPCGLDLVSLNIQRGRDHGLPSYTAWRKFCGLAEVPDFEHLRGQMDPDALDEISKLYEDVDDVDLYTGALAEIHDEYDGLVGPTFKCIIGDQFSRIQEGDRFWYEVPDEPHSFNAEQLREIRKSSLAKLICECSDDISQIQPEVMRSVGPENPVISCEDIPELDYSFWRDKSPLKLGKSAESPEAWLDFQRDINETIRQVVTFFANNTLAPGSTDWSNFGNWINNSFAELGRNISTFYGKPVADAMLEEPPNLRVFNKYPINNEFQAASQTRLSGTGSSFNWMEVRNELTKYFNNSLATANGEPTAEEREELVKKIATEIKDIKGIMKSMKKPNLKESEGGIGVDKAAKTEMDRMVEDDLIKSVNAAIDRIAKEAPPPGDPAWAESYGTKIKQQFIAIKDLFNKTNESVDTDGPFDWYNFKSDIIHSVADIAEAAKKNASLAGAKDWPALKKIIASKFSKISGKVVEKSSAGEKSTKNVENAAPSPEFDWASLKIEIIRSISRSPDENKDSIGQKLFTEGQTSKTNLGLKKSTNDAIVTLKPDKKDLPLSFLTTDWNDFKTKINKSIEDQVNTIKSKVLPSPGDTKGWAAFRDSLNDQFVDLKNEINSFKNSTFPIVHETLQMQPIDKSFTATKMDSGKMGKSPRNHSFEWTAFANNAKATKFDSFEKLSPSKLLITAPDWAEFKREINATVTSFVEKFNNTVSADPAEWIKTKSLIEQYFTEFREELNSWRNKTV